MEAMRGKNRAPRVISTDKLDQADGQRDRSSADAACPAAQRKPADACAPVRRRDLRPLQPAASGAACRRRCSPRRNRRRRLTGTAQAEDKPSQPADQTEAKQEKHERVAKKAKRKPKAEPKAQPKDESNDDDDHVASADADDRPSDDRVRRSTRGRADRRRIVERWTERDYNVPSTDGRGDRRVTVIRRDNGGGIFGNLFGGFGN